MTRAGCQRPSCCLARHAEPACRELRSGSWKGRSSATGTTCPWENLRRGRGAAQAPSSERASPGRPGPPAWASRCRQGRSGDTRRRAHARAHALHVCGCPWAHTRIHPPTCTCLCTCTHPRVQTCTHMCTRVYTAPHACTCSCAWEGHGCPEDKKLHASARLSGREGRGGAVACDDGPHRLCPHARPRLEGAAEPLCTHKADNLGDHGELNAHGHRNRPKEKREL